MEGFKLKQQLRLLSIIEGFVDQVRTQTLEDMRVTLAKLQVVLDVSKIVLIVIGVAVTLAIITLAWSTFCQKQRRSRRARDKEEEEHKQQRKNNNLNRGAAAEFGHDKPQDLS